MSVETSVIVRTKNEEKWLGVVLGRLFEQNYEDFEVIIVDSGSTDKTLEIAKKFPVKIFEISQEHFSYPYALNYGIERSNATRFIVIISGHSVPVSNTWLADGLENFKKYLNIMGVYGYLEPMPDASFWDRFFMKGINFLRRKIYKNTRLVIDKAGMGVLGFTNAVVLKKLWGKKHFNEEYGAGGEDGEWADYWFKKGYKAVKDPKFTVRHSHNLSLLGWYKQWKYWKSLSKPYPFERLLFRKNKTHSK